MSYIRCLSNPESLYIWGDTADNSGFANICHRVKPPLSSKWPKNGNSPLIMVPLKAFEEATRKWRGSYDGSAVEVDGFKVETVNVFTATGKRVPKKNDFLKDRRRREWLVRLSYKGQFVHLWDVTWSYVVNNVEGKPVRRTKKAVK